MTTDKLTPPTASTPIAQPPIAMTAPAKMKEAKPDKKAGNSTDATQGEALAVRAQVRKVELEALLAKVPAHDATVRADIERALASVATLLSGDSKHLAPTTAAELNRWLEGAKHLGEVAPPAATPKPVH